MPFELKDELVKLATRSNASVSQLIRDGLALALENTVALSVDLTRWLSANV
jgi:hypothetical protein